MRRLRALLADTRPLQVPAYRRLWTARTVSQWGDAFNTVALALLVYALTGSGLGVTGVVIAEIVPVLTLAPLAGSLIDRLPGVRVMIGADLGRAVLAFVLPFIEVHVSARRSSSSGPRIAASSLCRASSSSI